MLCRTRQAIIADKTIELPVHHQRRQTIGRQRIIEYPPERERESCGGGEQKCTYILVLVVVQTVVSLEDKPPPVPNVAALISTTG